MERRGRACIAGTRTGSAASLTADSASCREARALIKDGRFNEALVLLGPVVERGTIDSDVLFLIGLAASGASQKPGLPEEDREALLDGAIAAFRSILIHEPGLVRVRLELGLAFFLKEEDDLARDHFERVLAGGPPAPVIANVTAVLEGHAGPASLERVFRVLPGPGYQYQRGLGCAVYLYPRPAVSPERADPGEFRYRCGGVGRR